MVYQRLFKEKTIIGYHATNNAEDILKNNFDENQIKVAFLGKGFSFSTTYEDLKNYPKNKNILKCEIFLKNPLTDYKIWENQVKSISTNNKSLEEISTILRKNLENLGYDGILAFKKYGWWKNNSDRLDEIIVFRSKNIKNIKLEEKNK